MTFNIYIDAQSLNDAKFVRKETGYIPDDASNLSIWACEGAEWKLLLDVFNINNEDNVEQSKLNISKIWPFVAVSNALIYRKPFQDLLLKYKRTQKWDGNKTDSTWLENMLDRCPQSISKYKAELTALILSSPENATNFFALSDVLYCLSELDTEYEVRISWLLKN